MPSHQALLDGASSVKAMTPQDQEPNVSPSFPCSAEEAEWASVKTWVRLYGWMTAAALLLGSVLLAHPGLLGLGSFSTCQNGWCTGAMHLVEIPVIGYLLFVAFYAALRANHRAAARFWLFLGFANAVGAGLFLFDGVLLVESLRRVSPPSEKFLYFTAMALLLVGVGLGVWVQSRVNGYLHPSLDPDCEHPRTEEELIQLVKKALAYKVQIRVRGSGHCVREGVYADQAGGNINVQLDRYNRVIKLVEDGDRAFVTVQAGCHLGVDPRDPLSNKKNSLLWQLDKLGWALPDLGGIAHQTVSGFMSTGSMGGTIRHDLGGAIVGIRIIDGHGRVRDLTPEKEKEAFCAAGVSMGLLGIVSTVTFECTPRYNIEGRQEISTAKESPLFKSGKGGLERFVGEAKHTYTRLLWWPQRGVDRVELWTGKRPKDPTSFHERVQSRCKAAFTQQFKLRPLVPFPRLFQWLIIRPFYTYLAKVDPLPYEERTAKFVIDVLETFLRKKKRPFGDVWYKALPMDDSVSDKLVPTEFTELFIDISQTDKLLQVLQEYLCPDEEHATLKQAMERTGSYAFEIYPGHSSRFWLSPSFGHHSIRLDVFWYRTENKGNDELRQKFFARIWNLLRENDIDFRLHWGKHLPEATDPRVGAAYLRRQYPKWDDFMELRRKWDPEGIFLNTYWKEHLGLEHPRPHLKLADAGPALEVNGIPATSQGTQGRLDAAIPPDWRRTWLRAETFVVKQVFRLVDWLRPA